MGKKETRSGKEDGRREPVRNRQPVCGQSVRGKKSLRTQKPMCSQESLRPEKKIAEPGKSLHSNPGEG